MKKEQHNRILCGDSVEKLKLLESDSVDLTVTSPPYDDIRFYSDEFTAEFNHTRADYESEKEYKKELLSFKRKKMLEKLSSNN